MGAVNWPELGLLVLTAVLIIAARMAWRSTKLREEQRTWNAQVIGDAPSADDATTPPTHGLTTSTSRTSLTP